MQIKKSQKASLEDKKIIYVLMGFVLVLSVCYVAFEWTEKEVTKYEVQDTDFLFEEEVEIQQTQQQETTPPPPPPAVQEVEVLNVVEDDVETETIEINAEDDKETEVVIAPPVEAPVEEEEEEVVFVVVETMPEFPGGQQALFKYLSENVKYPVIAQENGIQGRVICQFVVNKDGAIVDVEVVRSGGDPSLDKEAMRVIKSMPKWNPGKQRGKAVRVKYTVPVNFRLQ
ncbi:MAG: energy transducer TonB [Paludibacteraceae bacterium]|nr:energy transducer TonB [Paludibacteraceae bacterium]